MKDFIKKLAKVVTDVDFSEAYSSYKDCGNDITDKERFLTFAAVGKANGKF